MIKGISNLVIAVKDLDAAIAQYTNILGFAPQTVRKEGRGGFINAFFRMEHGNVELIQPAGAPAEHPMVKSLESRGEGVYMISLEADSLTAHVQAMNQGGMNVREQPFEMDPTRQVAYVSPRHTRGVLMQVSSAH